MVNDGRVWILTKAVYAMATKAMTGIETVIGSPVAKPKIKKHERSVRKREIHHQIRTAILEMKISRLQLTPVKQSYTG